MSVLRKMKKTWKLGKKGIELNMLGYWIIGIIVLVVAVAGIMILSGKGDLALEYIKDLLRFGR